MGFRRDKEQALKWKHWLDRCRPTLVAYGLPEEAYSDTRHWLYFLGHATLSTGKESHWLSLDMLRRDQLETLRALLEAEYGYEAYPPILVLVLRGELGQGGDQRKAK
jgi:hypothetical protein